MTTSSPALHEFAIVPTFTTLNFEQQAALDQLPAELTKLGFDDNEAAAYSREERCAFLKGRKWNAADTAAQLVEAHKWLQRIGDVTIEDVAPFMRTANGRPSGVDGCMVLLEDGRGGCARDKLGRPICLAIGMSHGSRAEQVIKTLIYKKIISVISLAQR
jgi:hypothetical protein